MKIAYISKSVIPSRAANSVHVMKMCQAFSNNDCDVTLYCTSSNCNDNVYEYYGVKKMFNLEKTKLNTHKGASIFYAFKIFNKVKKNRDIDFIYGRHLLSLLFLSFLNIPFAYEAHSLPSSFVQRKIVTFITKKSNFRFLVTISDSLKSDFINIMKNIDEKIILTLHDGADLIESHHNSDPKNKQREIGYVGHLYSGRGIEIILDAAKSLPNIKFHIIGGEEKDIDCWKGKSNLSNVIFYGHVPNGKLKEFYSKFDIVLAPYQNKVSVSGGKGDTSKWMSPLKIFEYMAYKKAIVVSELDVLKEILEDENSCLFCRPNDTKDWINAINRLIEDDKLFEKVRKNGYELLKEKYTWNKRVHVILSRIAKG